jgi:hypothetical protein
MWLRDALALNPQGARLLLYGYDTGLVKSESFQDIDDIGIALSFGIKRIRSPQPVRRDFSGWSANRSGTSRVKSTLNQDRSFSLPIALED